MWENCDPAKGNFILFSINIYPEPTGMCVHSPELVCTGACWVGRLWPRGCRFHSQVVVSMRKICKIQLCNFIQCSDTAWYWTSMRTKMRTNDSCVLLSQ